MANRLRSSNITSSGEIGQLSYNERAHAARMIPVGADWIILGPIGSVTVIPGPGLATVMLANTTTAWHYVKFGTTSGVTAPTGLTDGLPIPPNSIAYYSAGLDPSGNLNRYLISDSASVGAYVIQENVAVVDDGRPKD